jgi:hypothetical protein
MFQRIVGVLGLKPEVFEEIEHDTGATGQAALVVLIVALLTGAGNACYILFVEPGNALPTILGGVVLPFVGWFLASAIVYFVGTRFFGGKADMGEMLRVIGFSMAPLALGIIPCLGGIIGTLWAMGAAFTGVRQGLDIDNTRTIFTVFLGFAVYIIGYLVLSGLGVINLF